MDMERYWFPCVDENINSESVEKCICKIYKRLADDKSKKIYEKRLLYSLTSDYRYIYDIIKNEQEGAAFIELLQEQGQCKKIYIYGAGIVGTRLPLIFPDVNWVGYFDKKATEYQLCNEMPVQKSTSLRGGGINNLIVISNTVGFETIREDLLKQGVRKENILILQEYNEKARKNQYFEKSCIGTGKEMKGCFVDIGCYDGEDVIGFYEWNGDEARSVMAFEADPYNYQKCINNLIKYQNVNIYNVGISDKEETLKFRLNGSQSSRFTDEGSESVITKPLDSFMKERTSGFIKMDVEGMEEKVICGAKNIIARDKPRLAISIYHKRSDIWRIPQLLLDINPEYRFYLRHYSLGVIDTVLYAVC